MSDFRLQIVFEATTRATMIAIAAEGFGDMVKAVVDVRRGIMIVGAQLHSDEEAALIDNGSQQQDLWGINLYPNETGEDWIEFDSMINVRPAQGNRSRGVDDEVIRLAIRSVVARLVTPV